MKTFAIVSAAACVLAAAVLTTSPASAAPTGSEKASDVVATLKAQGYNVMLNGSITEPLTECSVTGVHNPDASSGRAIGFTTVYVDVTCPDDE